MRTVGMKAVTIAFAATGLMAGCIATSSTDTACRPASRLACTCDNGASGTRVCDALGGFGACVCEGDPADGESRDGARAPWPFLDAGLAGGAGGAAPPGIGGSSGGRSPSRDAGTLPGSDSADLVGAGGAGGGAGSDHPCEVAADTLIACGIDRGECPGWMGEGASPRAELRQGLLDTCQANPALGAIVNAADDCSVIATVSGVSVEFATSCAGDGREPVDDDCAEQCDRFADCAVDPEVCQDFSPAVRDQLVAGCTQSCSDQLAAALAQQATCDDIVDFIISISDPQFAVVCGRQPPGPPPRGPECDTFSARVMACAVEACADARLVEAAFADELRGQCDELVASGQATAGQIAATIDENTPCQAAAVQQIVGLLIDRNPQDGSDGPLRALCTTGPATDPDVCAAACDHIDPCDEAGDINDPDICFSECVLDQASTVAFTCASLLDDCDEIADAFADGFCEGAGGLGEADAGGP